MLEDPNEADDEVEIEGTQEQEVGEEAPDLWVDVRRGE